jgi:ribonucleotide monophosphatase NagD (HAD superfamily)
VAVDPPWHQVFVSTSPKTARPAHSETTAMIGDRMDTEVVAGLEAGMHTVLVLTGSTARDDVDGYPYRPSRIVESVEDLLAEMEDEAIAQSQPASERLPSGGA